MKGHNPLSVAIATYLRLDTLCGKRAQVVYNFMDPRVWLWDPLGSGEGLLTESQHG